MCFFTFDIIGEVALSIMICTNVDVIAREKTISTIDRKGSVCVCVESSRRNDNSVRYNSVLIADNTNSSYSLTYPLSVLNNKSEGQSCTGPDVPLSQE